MFTSLFLKGIEVVVYRDDVNHDVVSGNKLHKLTPNIARAKERNHTAVLSFGGPYSNHLHALAWACKEAGLMSIGVVRGELHRSLTPTLQDCQKWGMKLIAAPRQAYRDCLNLLPTDDSLSLVNDCAIKPILSSLINKELNKEELNNDTLSAIQFDRTLVIPEGGSNMLAIASLKNAYRSVFNALDGQGITHAVCATGTGATLAGLYKSAPESVSVIGVQAVAEGGATLQRIRTWLDCTDTPSRLTLYEGHLGRFAKMTPELVSFMSEFEAQYKIPLDPVYTGKVMLGLSKMIEAGRFNASDKILFIHTGGLQGKRN